VIDFISEHKDHSVPGPEGESGLRWGVEPLCQVLTEHGIKIAPATYYEWVNRRPSRRALRDAEVTELIRAERRGDRRVVAGRDPLVSPRWRDDTAVPGRAHGPVPVVRRA
jgi:hypothetical protein